MYNHVDKQIFTHTDDDDYRIDSDLLQVPLDCNTLVNFTLLIIIICYPGAFLAPMQCFLVFHQLPSLIPP